MKEEKRRGREKERKEGRKKENCRVTIPLTLYTCVCVFMYFSCLLQSAPLAKQFPKTSLSTQDNNSQTSKF